MTQGQPDMSSFAYDAPFTPTRPRKKRKNRAGKQPADHPAALERTRQELLTGDWSQASQDLLRGALHALGVSPARILCLGLGSPTASRDARAQLAWLLEACDRLAIDRTAIEAYDPVFTDEDIVLLAALQVQRLRDSENSPATYALPESTIAYMPHCDLQLYEDVLRANWSPARLPQLVLIANRFSEYVDSIPSHKLHAAHPCVARLGPLLTSLPLPPCPPQPSAFNNLAVQFARADALAPAGADFWDLPPLRPPQARGPFPSSASAPQPPSDNGAGQSHDSASVAS